MQTSLIYNNPLLGRCNCPKHTSPTITQPSLSCCPEGVLRKPNLWSSMWCASIRSLPIKSNISASSVGRGIHSAMSFKWLWNIAISSEEISSRTLGTPSHVMRVGSLNHQKILPHNRMRVYLQSPLFTVNVKITEETSSLKVNGCSDRRLMHMWVRLDDNVLLGRPLLAHVFPVMFLPLHICVQRDLTWLSRSNPSVG